MPTGGGGMDLSERTSQHSPSSAGSRPNCIDDDDAGERSDGGLSGVVGSNGHSNGHQSHNHHLHQQQQQQLHDEPPMDYSRTHQQQQQQQLPPNALQQLQDTAQNLMMSRRSPTEVKTEPMDTTSVAAVNNSGSAYADDSNDSAADFTGVHPAIGMSEPDDTSYQSHHSYLDSKFFAAAGASFNFSMAAAMAADSLAGKYNTRLFIDLYYYVEPTRARRYGFSVMGTQNVVLSFLNNYSAVISFKRLLIDFLLIFDNYLKLI